MTASVAGFYGAADMRADWCTAGDEVCDIAGTCPECGGVICPEHCDEFTTCVADQDVLHHLDCQLACVECAAARAQDHAEGDD